MNGNVKFMRIVKKDLHKWYLHNQEKERTEKNERTKEWIISQKSD